MLTSQIEGYRFWGVHSVLGLFSRFLHLTAFLLFVPNTRVLTIAHIYIYNCIYIYIYIFQCSPLTLSKLLHALSGFRMVSLLSRGMLEHTATMPGAAWPPRKRMEHTSTTHISKKPAEYGKLLKAWHSRKQDVPMFVF